MWCDLQSYIKKKHFVKMEYFLQAWLELSSTSATQISQVLHSLALTNNCLKGQLILSCALWKNE